MEIYTSYFAKYKAIPDNFIKVSIARYKPAWLSGIQTSDDYCLDLKQAAPSPWLLQEIKSKKINEVEYTKRYMLEIQNRLEDIQRYFYANLLSESLRFPNKDSMVLFCYEKPTDFCHRHILAKMLNEKFNLGIKEYQF